MPFPKGTKLVPRTLERRRILAALLVSRGYTTGQAATEVGASQRSVRQWVSDYGRFGFDAVMSRGPTGRRPKVRRENLASALDAFRATKIWTVAEFRGFLLENFGAEYSDVQTRRLMRLFRVRTRGRLPPA